MTENKNKNKKRPSTTITMPPDILAVANDVGEQYRGGKSEYIETLLLADFKKRGLSLAKQS